MFQILLIDAMVIFGKENENDLLNILVDSQKPTCGADRNLAGFFNGVPIRPTTDRRKSNGGKALLFGQAQSILITLG